MQLSASIPNLLCQEQVSLGEGYIKKPFTVRDGWTQLSIIMSPHDALDNRSLLDALKDGDIDAAVGVAASFGDTGA